jgi:hypothetical protein
MFNDTSNINLINNLVNSLNNDENLNYNIEIIDISNTEYNRIDSSRNLIIGELLNMNNSLRRNLFFNLLESSIENIIDNRENSFIENFINSTFETDNKKKIKRVINDEELNNLKIEKFNKNKNYKNIECPINLINFEEGDDIIMLECEHIYIADSIKKWLTEESNCCPICRFELKFKEIENSEEGVISYERNEERRRGDENNEIINLNNYDIALQEILLNSYASER